MLEGTNVSEGRGTSSPFKLFGSPWLNSKKLISALNKYNFNGVVFSIDKFIPVDIEGKAMNPKYENELCHGVRIKVIDKNTIKPFSIASAIIYEIHKLHPDKFEFKDDFFDKLYGSSDLRLAIIESRNIDELIEKNKKDIEVFKKLREKALLY